MSVPITKQDFQNAPAPQTGAILVGSQPDGLKKTNTDLQLVSEILTKGESILGTVLRIAELRKPKETVVPQTMNPPVVQRPEVHVQPVIERKIVEEVKIVTLKGIELNEERVRSELDVVCKNIDGKLPDIVLNATVRDVLQNGLVRGPLIDQIVETLKNNLSVILREKHDQPAGA